MDGKTETERQEETAPAPPSFAELATKDFGQLLDMLTADMAAAEQRRAAKIAAGSPMREFEAHQHMQESMMAAAAISGGRYLIRMVEALEAIATAPKK